MTLWEMGNGERGKIWSRAVSRQLVFSLRCCCLLLLTACLLLLLLLVVFFTAQRQQARSGPASRE